jgi:hypothetical protein
VGAGSALKIHLRRLRHRQWQSESGRIRKTNKEFSSMKMPDDAIAFHSPVSTWTIDIRCGNIISVRAERRIQNTIPQDGLQNTGLL